MFLLIVDDEYSIREGLRDTIDWRELGINKIETAKNGIEALQVMNSAVPDILLTDIRMPGMDGLELAGQTRADFPKTKIILVSGYADFTYAKKAISLGVKEYLIKPVNVNELLDKIREIILEIREESKEIRKQPLAEEEVSAEIWNAIRETPFSYGSLKKKFDKWKIKWDFPFLAAGMIEINLPAFSDYETMLTDFSNKLTFISNRYHIVITMALSRMFDSNEFQKAYQDVEHTFAFQFFIGKGIFFTSQQFQYKRFEMPAAPSSIKDLLIENIRAANIEKCLELLKPIFHSYRFADVSYIQQIKDACLELVTILTEEVSKNSKSAVKDNILKMGYTMHVCHFSVLEEFIQQVEILYCDIMDILKLSQASKSKWIIRRAKEYIEACYQENLTVDMIARQVDRNANYLCHIFNSMEGISITEYLNKLRIEKAKELLTSTTLMSYEISDRVGFSNYRYFTQIFKKYAEQSPTSYRNSIFSQGK